MSAPRRLLILGLGPYAKNLILPGKGGPPPLEDIATKVKAEIAAIRGMGFKCDQLNVDPADIPTALANVQEKLQSKELGGFVVGWGVRAIPECTDLFEKLVNLGVEETWGKSDGPRPKFVFPTAPDKIFEAVQKAFPNANDDAAGKIGQ